MANTCIFCHEELTLLTRKTMYCCCTEQPVCKTCYADLAPLSREEQGRRALATGRAKDPDIIRDYLSRQEAAEEEKLQAIQKREAYLEGKACLRCGIPMIKKGSRRFQMYEYESLSDAILNPSADTLLLDVLFCPQCRKVEFFLPTEEK